jgi:glycosyltransferase involved in cell wall biosynthesis
MEARHGHQDTVGTRVKIAAHLPLYPPHSLVGAWITTHEFLAHAASLGHQVDVVTFLAGRPTYELDGVTVHPRRTPEDADIVIGHAGDRGHSLKLAAGRPHVSMVHGQVLEPRRLNGSAMAVFNSATLERSTRWAGPSTVIHPPIDPGHYETTPGDRVTLVNLSTEKGGEVLFNLARKMPHVEFLAVRGGYGRQVQHPRKNVETIGPVTDMRKVYAQTRILLMPSSRESWGRVALEAAASGIPTIAAPCPGIVEAMGDGATYVERRDAQGWIDAIERLTDPTEWAAASAKALERSTFHDPDAELAKFADLVASLAPVPA